MVSAVPNLLIYRELGRAEFGQFEATAASSAAFEALALLYVGGLGFLTLTSLSDWTRLHSKLNPISLVTGLWVVLLLSNIAMGDRNLGVVYLLGFPLAVFLVAVRTERALVLRSVTQSLLGIVYISVILGASGTDWVFAGSARAFTLFPSGRLAGVAASPNGLAGIAVSAAALVMLRRPRSRLSLLHAGVCLIAVVASDSRSSAILVVIVIGIGLWLRRWKGLGGRGAALILGGLVLVPVVSLLTSSASDLRASVLVEDTLTARATTWEFVVGDASKAPPFLGRGTFAWERWNEDGRSPEGFPSAHNTAFQTIATSGFAGLCLIVLLLTRLAAHSLQEMKSGDWIPIALVVLIVLRGVTENELDLSHFTSDSLAGWLGVMTLVSPAIRSSSGKHLEGAYKRRGT